MQFVYPGFLFALSALAIPVLIHLFNFRRFRKILFTNVHFLQEIKQDTRSRSRLKHLLILLARLLTVIFLVLAFAQPLIPAGNTPIDAGVKSVGVYIDNSFSMEAVGKNGNLVETAKRKAREIANAYEPADHFQLLTNDFEARHQRVVNRDEFLQLVDEVRSGPAVRNLSEIITRQRDAFSNAKEHTANVSLYEISDFQKSITDMEKLSRDSSLHISLVPLNASEEKNIYIDTCYLATPFVQLNSPSELSIRIKNISDADAESVPVKLFINGTQRSLTSVNIPAGTAVVARLSFSISQPGWQQAVVSITDYPVTFDDNYYLSFEVKDHLDILSIHEKLPSGYINALFANDTYYRLKNSSVSQVEYSTFPTDNLIILDDLNEISSGLAQELKKYLLQGGALMIFPSTGINLSSYQVFLQSVSAGSFVRWDESPDKVDFIERKNPLFEDVFEKKNIMENIDFPSVSKHYQSVRDARSSAEVLMKLQSGDAFFSVIPVERGKLYLCASPLDETCTNFPRHALFVPVMLKAAMSGFNSNQHANIIGRNDFIEIPIVQLSGENILHLLNREQKFDIIPETRMVNNKPVMVTHDQVKQAGNYNLESGNKVIASVSFNYDRRESDLSCYSPAQLKSIAELAGIQTVLVLDGNKELSHTVREQNEGTRLWKYCIWLALLFLACEILLIRFMSSSKPITPKGSKP